MINVQREVAQWIERATSGQEVVGLITAPVPYWLGRCEYNVRSHGLPSLAVCGSR